jgi:hypothetical protein
VKTQTINYTALAQQYQDKFKILISSKLTIPNDVERLETEIYHASTQLLTALDVKDIIGIAKHTGELIHLLFQLVNEFGLPIESIIEEIHKNKMKYPARYNPQIAAIIGEVSRNQVKK